MSDDPFGVLGLPRRPGLSDDDVRAAWRRIAAATHPDRDDGGDPVRYGAAAAAYATLRTAYGRGEALADLADLGQVAGAARPGRHAGDRRRLRGQPGARGRHGAPGQEGAWGSIRLPGRHGTRGVRRVGGVRGRPWMLALRAAGAAAVCMVAFAVAGWAPATIGVLAGSAMWLIVTGRHDLR